MKKLTIVTVLVALLSFPTDMNAQGFLKKLKDKALEKAKDKIENKVERTVDEEMDAVLDGKKKEKSESNSKAQREVSDDAPATAPVDDTPATVAQSQKSDFKRGNIVLFEDDFAGEQMGEFPSKWDPVDGNAETAMVNGKKYLNFNTGYDRVQPMMKNMDSYLPDVFTLEWDVFISKSEEDGQSIVMPEFFMSDDSPVGHIEFTFRSWDFGAWLQWGFKKPNNDDIGGANMDGIVPLLKKGQWNHFAVSFNKRAIKFYINDVRLINLPNVAAPAKLKFFANGDYKYRGFGHVILAKGGVDLYERTTTDLSAVEKAIAETGKFVTNNILFETGKATLKSESMTEIEKVAAYMKKNPRARFEVQGHTDNQGSDKINDPLSQQRAEAVVKALASLGVDDFNLKAVGKGSHEPVADNKTEAGRAKNRRVEFIKK